MWLGGAITRSGHRRVSAGSAQGEGAAAASATNAATAIKARQAVRSRAISSKVAT
jgi:hypothetical protein